MWATPGLAPSAWGDWRRPGHDCARMQGGCMTVDTEILRSRYSLSEFESGKDSHLVTAEKDRQLVTVSQEDTGDSVAAFIFVAPCTEC